MAHKIAMGAFLVTGILAWAFAMSWNKPTATGVDHSDAAIERRHQRYLERESAKQFTEQEKDEAMEVLRMLPEWMAKAEAKRRLRN